MGSYSTARDAIAVQLAAIADIGTVSTRERFATDHATFLEKFGATIAGQRQARGWVVTLERISNAAHSFGTNARTYHFLIYGILGMKDASATEGTFLDLVELILDTLDNETTLGVTGALVGGVGPATMRLHQLRNFGSVLCHYCEIECPVVVMKAT